MLGGWDALLDSQQHNSRLNLSDHSHIRQRYDDLFKRIQFRILRFLSHKLNSHNRYDIAILDQYQHNGKRDGNNQSCGYGWLWSHIQYRLFTAATSRGLGGWNSI
jgi:hypothetical protein